MPYTEERSSGTGRDLKNSTGGGVLDWTTSSRPGQNSRDEIEALDFNTS